MTDSNFISLLTEEVRLARKKFPGNNMLLAALMEEVGELAHDLIEYRLSGGYMEHRKKSRMEAVQVACIALRIATEFDSDFLTGVENR